MLGGVLVAQGIAVLGVSSRGQVSHRGVDLEHRQGLGFRVQGLGFRRGRTVGLILSIGKAADTALTKAGPPATPGNSFWIGAPFCTRCV